MNLQYKVRIFFLLFCFFGLAACNQLGIKDKEEQQPQEDLFEIQAQADEAYQANKYALAEEKYEMLIKASPENAKNWFRLGNIYVRTNRPVAAINLYREAVLRDPTFSKAWFNLSIVQLKQTAYSLNEMLIYVDKNDPMYTRAKNLLDGIQEIVQSE